MPNYGHHFMASPVYKAAMRSDRVTMPTRRVGITASASAGRRGKTTTAKLTMLENNLQRVPAFFN